MTNSEALNFSRIILGFWRLADVPAQDTIRILNTALEVGVDTIDQADIYGGYYSQEYLGRAFKADASLRKKFKIVSKAGIVTPARSDKPSIGYYDTTSQHLTQSVEKTLSDLGTDYIDLLLIHRPDQLMDPVEIDETFKSLKKAGKVLNFGVSNFTVSQFEMMKSRMETSLVANQIEFSVLNPSPLFDGTLDQCLQHQIMPMAWSPMGGGSLFTGNDEPSVRVRAELEKISKELGGVGLDALALSWILRHPAKVHPVIGTMKPERVKSAIEALKVKLTNEQWYRILVASQGHPVP